MAKNSNSVQELKSTKEYFKITFQKRKQLIRLVEEENISIKKASERVNINYSTSKLIMKKYRDCGKITIFSYEKPGFQQNSHRLKTDFEQNIKNIEQQALEEAYNIRDSEIDYNLWGWIWIPLNPLNNHQNLAIYNFPFYEQIQTFYNQQFYNFNF